MSGVGQAQFERARTLVCPRCGCNFRWLAPDPRGGAGVPPLYCSTKCKNRAKKNRAQSNVVGRPTLNEPPSEDVEKALEAVTAAPDDDTARSHFQLARALGATRKQLYAAWRTRYEQAVYRQPRRDAGRQVTRCLTGKWSYPSDAEARKALNSLLRIRAVRDLAERFEQRSYLCDRCDGWHLTSSPLRYEESPSPDVDARS